MAYTVGSDGGIFLMVDGNLPNEREKSGYERVLQPMMG